MEERYTELFQNVYGAKNEHPLNKIEEKREEIKDIVKEALGMLNQARDMAFGIDETEIQDDITNALNIFLAAEEKQQELPPGEIYLLLARMKNFLCFMMRLKPKQDLNIFQN